MTGWEIFVAILSSSLLAAGLTSAVNYYLTSVNYKNEYYKKLLDKRLDAYQEVDNFLLSIKTHIHDTEDSLLTPYILVNGIDALDKTIIHMLVPLKKSLWLSPELANHLTQLNVLFVELGNKARLENNPDKSLRLIGSAYLEDIRALRKKIQNQMRIDLTTLDDVKTFISNAQKE